MKKGQKNNIEQVPLTGKPEHLLGRVDVFKKMCRMLEMKRKGFLENDWQLHYSKFIPRQQFLHLMICHQQPKYLSNMHRNRVKILSFYSL